MDLGCQAFDGLGSKKQQKASFKVISQRKIRVMVIALDLQQFS